MALNHPEFSAFAHLTSSSKSELYRSIMEGFGIAKNNFLLQMTRQEIFDHVNSQPWVEPYELESVDNAIRQLVEWKNLERFSDVSTASTLEEFNNPPQIYQMTATGEAVEQAIQHFTKTLQSKGELQATALVEIRDLLREIHDIATKKASMIMTEEERSMKLLRTTRALCERFEELTNRAQSFLSTLHKPGESISSLDERFMAYKESLIKHIDRFIGELARMSADIKHLLLTLDALGLDDLFTDIARQELIDAVETSQGQLMLARQAWQKRWVGLRSWFIGPKPGTAAQADRLREQAREAIRLLLQAVERINDRLQNRTDRIADLCTLAEWFMESDTTEEAHVLWQTAFGLTSSRHLGIDEQTSKVWEQEGVTGQTSWLDAPPIHISPRLRKSGKLGPQKRTTSSPVIDKSREKKILAENAASEASTMSRAQEMLVDSNWRRISDLPKLDAYGLDLLLGMIADASIQDSGMPGEMHSVSSDGSLEMRMRYPEVDTIIALETEEGDLYGPDYHILIGPFGSLSQDQDEIGTLH